MNELELQAKAEMKPGASWRADSSTIEHLMMRSEEYYS